MYFPKEYFKDEIKSGFYVPGKMKRSWAAQLEVLKAVDDVCQKYGLQYFAEFGTLLGAIRHHGFIPWDDDIDIGMKRADYNTFISVASKELPSGFSLLNVYTESEYTAPITRIVNERSIRLDREHLERYHEFPYVVGLDLFPLDYISSNKDDDELQTQLFSMIRNVAENMSGTQIGWGNFEEYIVQIEQVCGVSFDKTKPIRQQLLILMDRISSLYTEEEAEYITIIELWVKHKYKLPKEIYSDVIRVPFEEYQIFVPAAYDEALKIKFDDYMKIVRNTASHDYPFFKDQEKELFAKTGVNKKYKFDKAVMHRRLETVIEKPTKDILMIVYDVQKWKALDSLYRRLCEADENNVYVMPVPYNYKCFDGSLKEEYYDIDEYPKDINLINYKEVELDKLHPDFIYIQDPFDEYNDTISVNENYYARNLRDKTNKLIYVQSFLQDDYDRVDEISYANMDYYCTMPGLVYADEIIVQSDKMKERYIEKLTDWAGADTKEYWENKIKTEILPIKEYIEKEKRQKESAYPSDWDNVIYKNGVKKKVIIYGIGSSFIIENKEAAVQKLKKSLDIFREQKESVALILALDGNMKYITEQKCPEIWKDFEDTLQVYQSENWGIYVENIDEQMLVGVADAYYGDSGTLAHEMTNQKKPVMIQDAKVI